MSLRPYGDYRDPPGLGSAILSLDGGKTSLNREPAAARAAAENAARDSYGRLLAYLASRAGDIAAAEDALADAFAKALAHWPQSGPPRSPEAWLVTVARRNLIDQSRRRRSHDAAKTAIERAMDEAVALTAAAANDENPFADERLKLLFICAHPAIDPAATTPLMLQTVLGLDAARIAGAFLVQPAAMAQRLVRAKRKIAAAKIPFETPDLDEHATRLPAVLDAIYAAFGVGAFSDFSAGVERSDDLAAEALFLANLTAALAPYSAEALGLNALVQFVASRREARERLIDGERRYAPFDEQDSSNWDRSLIAAAEANLKRAAKLSDPGRYQLEAAIQSAHIARRIDGVDTTDAVISLYQRLMRLAPSTGAMVAYAAALLRAGRASEAIANLERLAPEKVADHQPYWATLAHARQAVNDAAGAEAAFDRAIALTTEPAIRDFLLKRHAR